MGSPRSVTAYVLAAGPYSDYFWSEVKMRAVRMAEDFVPVSEFKARAADLLRQVAKTEAPIVMTVNGKPAGVVLSPRMFDELTERARFLDAVAAGLSDADAERIHAHEDVVARLRSRRAR